MTLSPTLARIPVPFRWNVNDGLNGSSLIARAYSSEVAGVLTRTSTKRVSDRNGVVVPLVQGIPPIGWVNGAPALLLEPARTNLCIRSEEFGNSAWTTSAVGTVATADVAVAPSLATTADLLSEDGSTGNHYNSQSPTVTNVAHTFSVYYKLASGTRKLALYHAGTNVGRQFDASGVSTAGLFSAPAGGYGSEAIGNGWYRSWITTTPAAGAASWRLWLVTSADVLSYTGDGASGFYVWGAQVEAGEAPSSYIPTVAATVTRNTDSLYFPFTLVPTAMTVYVRGIERSNPAVAGKAESALLAITGASLADASFGISKPTGATYATFHDPATLTSASVSAAAIARGDLVEVRSRLLSTGAVAIGLAQNGGAETTSNPSTAQALAAAWSGQRLNLNSYGTSSAFGQFAFTHVCVALGDQPLDIMRELAGV